MDSLNHQSIFEAEALQGAQYWMVHNPANQKPSVKHPSKSSAEAEARRLAKENPNQLFVVLEAVEAYKVMPLEPTKIVYIRS